MKLTAESTAINDGKLNTDIDNAQTTADTATTKANNAQTTADTATTKANNAQSTANQAKSVADNTAQYFWFKASGTDTGVHITETTQSEFVANPSGGNLLARSNGIAVRDGLTELASFGATKAQIGKESTGHTVIQASGMQIYGSNGTVELANIGYGSGKSESGSTATAPYYSLGKRLSGSTVGNYSVANGYDCTASGFSSHAEGRYTVASEVGAHAEGHMTVASDYEAHAEGNQTTASQLASHAEGSGTTASGIASHAEGMQTQATGAQSHAGGYHTIANGDFQTAIGKYNVADTSSLFIVGKGTADDARSNAFSVGNTGNVYVNGTQVHSSDRRLKDHISYLGDEAVEFINGLKPAHYTKDGEPYVGFYAQDVKEVDKWDCMTGEMNGYMTLGYMELIAPLVAYVQRLEERIAELERSSK